MSYVCPDCNEMVNPNGPPHFCKVAKPRTEMTSLLEIKNRLAAIEQQLDRQMEVLLHATHAARDEITKCNVLNAEELERRILEQLDLLRARRQRPPSKRKGRK